MNETMQKLLEEVVEEAKEEGRQEEREQIEQRIGFLRQWLNEDRIGKNKLVSSKDIKFWLFKCKNLSNKNGN